MFKDQGVNWFIKYNAISDGLSNLFQLDIGDRQSLLKAFRDDLNFYQNLDNDKYQLKFLSLADDIKNVAKPFFTALYDDILGGSTGFRMDGLSINGLRREHVRKGYFQENRLSNGYPNPVCPACLGSIEVNLDDGYADLDHYLTKSIYPTLSLSPDNLIPLCKICNQSIKHAENPLKNHLGPGGLLNIFVPYHRTGMEVITVEIDHNGLHERFMIRAMKGKESEASRVANFEALFQLNQRWSDKIHASLYETVKNDVIVEFKDENIPINEELVKKKLEKMYQKHIRSYLTVPDEYVLAQYIDNLSTDHQMFMGFYKEIAETIEMERNDPAKSH